MDNQRLLTWGLFLMLAWFTYQTWQQDYKVVPAVVETAPTETDALPSADAPPGLPAVSSPTDEPPAAQVSPDDSEPDAPVISVVTDVFDVTIDTRGGTIVEAKMLGYPVSKDNPDIVIQTLSPEQANYGLVRTGLRGGIIADHTALYDYESESYTLADDDSIVVPLTWVSDDGVRVEKRLTFKRGSYQVDVAQTVLNNSAATWSGDFYVQLLRRSFKQERSMFDIDSYSFDGGVIYDGESSEKLDRDDLISGDSYSNAALLNGWVASIEHHFLNAIVPVRDTPHAYQVDTANSTLIASVVSPKQSVAPGASHTFETRTFIGPKLQAQLEELDPKLKLTVDYGILTILSQPMFWLLSLAFSYVANWGLAIIIVTILIKLVFYKLTESSGRSMAKMRTLQPRMKALQDRYKDDRQALSQAMMDLYKREKVNPVAGCLPILVQMPFFLAFYWVLVESVEMRQAPFALWLTDLSSRDPYFILPLIMGAAMLIQQKLNPAPTDPVQAKVMQIMPIMFTGFFAFFPSGLVLYWATNTILSIAQQWKINRVVEAETKAEKNKGGKGRKNKAPSDD